MRDLPNEIKIEAKEIRGPKIGVPENIIEGFMRSHQITKKDLFEKVEEKSKFYCFKKIAKKILTEDVLIQIVPKAITSINWKKSMRWSDHDLMWGRPLRSILTIFDNLNVRRKIEVKLLAEATAKHFDLSWCRKSTNVSDFWTTHTSSPAVNPH